MLWLSEHRQGRTGHRGILGNARWAGDETGTDWGKWANLLDEKIRKKGETSASIPG